MTSWQDRFRLDGRRALVTGASKGLGATIAAVLADAGADLVITGRDVAGLAQTRDTVTAAGRRCCVIEADLRTVEGPRQVGEQALEFFGIVDILVNNAGIAYVQTLLDTSLENWEEMQAVNLRAPFLLAQVIAPGMIAQRRGKIVNISSLAGGVAQPGHSAYSAAKSGLNMLTACMASEWGAFNIQANAIAPTVVLTDMGRKVWSDPAKSGPKKARIPVGRFGEPIEIADMALYLASPASDFVSGQVLYIDGGYSAV